MANAGGAWDNAKKIVEVELKQKGTPLHDATVVGDTVGDPFKDTSSVAMNPVIKFTTLFGLLAVELAVKLTAEAGGTLGHSGRGIFPGIVHLRVPLVLRHAHREGRSSSRLTGTAWECHPERSGSFAKRSCCVVEGPLSACPQPWFIPSIIQEQIPKLSSRRRT